MRKRFFLGTYRLFFGFLALAAVIVQLAHQIPQGSFVLYNFFSFFTIQSNLLAIVLLLVTGVLALRGKPHTSTLNAIRGAVTLYMVVVGIIYVVLLSGLDSSLQTTIPWVNTVVHYIMPVIVLADWCIDLPRTALSFKRVLWWLIFPVAYLVYSLLRGHIVAWYPYPFLNVSQHGYATVSVMCIIVAAVFVALAWLLAWTSRLRHI